MKKTKNFKVRYIYNKPKAPEEKERQQRKIDETCSFIFKKITERHY